jgi:hypothetical protein
MSLRDPVARKAYNAAYRARRREELNAIERERYHAEGGKTKRQEYRQGRLEQYAIYQRESRRKNPREHIVMAAKARAKRDGLPFNISVESLNWPEYCPVLGIKLDYSITTPGERRKRYANPSLDRLVNELGYVNGNSFIISHRANRIKSDATVEEIEAVLKYMKGKK